MSLSDNNAFTARYEKLKQQREGVADAAAHILNNLETPKTIIVKPMVSSWADLEKKLQQVINFPGLLKTVRELYEQGYGAEIETAAEIALAKAKKSPFCMFAAMVSKKAGNWKKITLQMVRDTWEVRRNAVEVMERLKLTEDSTKAVLALAWRLKGAIVRFLAIATEQGTGINNPAGIFFALTKKQPSTA